MSGDQSRRDILKLTAGALAAVPALSQVTTSKFFTADEFRMIDELAEMIIPADEHSPGAHAAEVAAYLDKTFAEAFDDTPRLTWRNGLELVNTISKEMSGKPFLASTAEQKLDVLTRMSQNEAEPKKPEEIFFVDLKHKVAHAYYSSNIGIHQEIGYLGNSIQQEFAGYDAKLIQLKPTKIPAP